MKFFRASMAVLLYCIAWVHAISCIIRIGREKQSPIFPGQIWNLPGVGSVVVTNISDRFVYYELIDNHDKTWYCRSKTFQDFGQIIEGKPAPTPVEHLISKQENNVIHLKKDEKNDRV